MNMGEKITTERLILLPSRNDRDNAVFLKMLREDGDFRMFCGVDFSEENLLNFNNYFEHKETCYFSVFLKSAPERFIGYVGISNIKDAVDVEFYIAKKFRNAGYCTEALYAVCRNAIESGLDFDGVKIIFECVNAVVIDENHPARKALDKCGFKRDAEHILFGVGIVPADDGEPVFNEAMNFILKGDRENG